MLKSVEHLRFLFPTDVFLNVFDHFGFAFMFKPAIAQLVEHLTVECCSNQMVPGSIPGGRIFCRYQASQEQRNDSPLCQKASCTASLAQLVEHALRKRTVTGSIPVGGFYLSRKHQASFEF